MTYSLTLQLLILFFDRDGNACPLKSTGLFYLQSNCFFPTSIIADAIRHNANHLIFILFSDRYTWRVACIQEPF
jgi:hypothetical protein